MEPGRQCPYLGTVHRELLDFDLPRQCCQTLATHNVYACLVCGVFLQGRGEFTPAHTHSLQNKHYLYIHLTTGKCYCLPEMYEVEDAGLSDIQFNLNPVFCEEEIAHLTANPPISRAIDGVRYLSGTVGLNNLKASDYLNTVLQVLYTVPELRNTLLAQQAGEGLTEALGDLFRRMVNPKGFRSHAAPYQAVKAIERLSKGFSAGRQGDPQAVWTWTLNRLMAENVVKKQVKRCFQGQLSKDETITPFL